MSAPSSRSVALAVVALAVFVWLLAGAPWWAPALAFAVAVLVRLVGRLLPRRLRPRAVMAAAMTLGVAVLPLVSPWALVLVLGIGVAAIGALAPLGLEGRSRGAVLAAGALAVCTGAGGVLVDSVVDERQRRAAAEQASAFNRAQLLPATPAQAARQLVDAIATADPTACGMFAPPAATEFASAAGAPDCRAAVLVRHAALTDPGDYASPDSRALDVQAAGEAATVDGCSMTWDGLAGILGGTTRSAPGPQLGVLEVRRELEQGYRITTYRDCS